MVGIYVILAIGFCVFCIINVLLYTYGFLQISIILTIIFEIMALWICFGPELILYYVMTLKESIESYAYLYEQFEEAQKTMNELERQNIKNKKQYKETLNKVTDTPYKLLETQKMQIQELIIENQQLNRQNLDLRENLKKAKQIIETNKQLKEENEKLKKMIKYLKET